MERSLRLSWSTPEIPRTQAFPWEASRARLRPPDAPRKGRANLETSGASSTEEWGQKNQAKPFSRPHSFVESGFMGFPGRPVRRRFQSAFPWALASRQGTSRTHASLPRRERLRLGCLLHRLLGRDCWQLLFRLLLRFLLLPRPCPETRTVIAEIGGDFGACGSDFLEDVVSHDAWVMRVSGVQMMGRCSLW